MRKIWFIILLAITACTTKKADLPKDVLEVLQFNLDGTYKIAQFTDLHIDYDSETTLQTFKIIGHVLDTEEPDIAILTGDIVTAGPVKEGWLALSEVFTDHGVKWTVTLGNHDDEGDMSREDIFDLLVTMSEFVGTAGPDISGVGNFILPVFSSGSGTVEALLYFLDSHGYPPEGKPGVYDWIKFDQIEWYRKKSIEFTNANEGNPVPALAFFHIPFSEFIEVFEEETTIGAREEDVCSPLINTGLFASMVEMGDIMGVFTGHDHVNNYIGILHNIALGYGQVTGLNAYGHFERGGRIIEIKEGQHSFNTWIRTLKGESLHYNYPFD